MADKPMVDRVGRTHIVDSEDFRERALCGYFGVLTEADPDVEAEYPCTGCKSHVERRLAAQQAGHPVPQPGRTGDTGRLL